MHFADRLDFAARADRLARRHGARHLAARARAARLITHRTCSAPSAGAPLPEALSRALRAPWQGGLAALARAAGLDRIEPGCDARLAPTCFAPAIPAEANTHAAVLRAA